MDAGQIIYIQNNKKKLRGEKEKLFFSLCTATFPIIYMTLRKEIIKISTVILSSMRGKIFMKLWKIFMKLWKIAPFGMKIINFVSWQV